jgi:histone deacetylase 1/2
MPLKFWDEAFLAATYLINRTPSRVIDFLTPLEKLHGVKSDYSSLRDFGCACWPNLRPFNNKKLQFRSKRCAFIGYNNLHKGFKCLDVSTGGVYISRDVVFDESVFPFSSLHPNAGAKLQYEVLLLPQHTGGTTVHEHATDASTNLPDNLQDCAENSGDTAGALRPIGPAFMPSRSGTRNEGDSAPSPAAAVSGSTPQSSSMAAPTTSAHASPAQVSGTGSSTAADEAVSAAAPLHGSVATGGQLD